jgi:PAS domain S-box-containing protein
MGNNHKRLERTHVGERLRKYDVEGLEEMIAVVDRDYRYLLANRAFLKSSGMTDRDQLAGRLVSDLLDRDVFERVVKPKLDECFQGRVVRYEMTHRYPEIGERVLQLTYLPIDGPDGIDSVACVLHDITEKRQAEEFLRQSELQMVEAQHIAKIGSWTWDLQTNSRCWSEELYRIFGLDPEKTAPSLDAALIECVHPDDREFVSSAIQTSINSKEPCSFFYRIIRPDGAERTIHSQGSVITDDSGNLIRMFGTAEDITAQRRAEDALREAERKYRDIFENASEGIFQSTPEGQYIGANPVLAHIHGFDSPEELIRGLKDISRQVYVDPNLRQEFKNLIETQGFVRGFEHQIFHRDGSKIWVSINARAVRGKHGEILYYEGTTQDINERKLAEARSAAFATLARKLSGATTKLGAARIIAETARELFGWDACNIDLYDADRDLILPMLKVDTIGGRRVEITEPSPGLKPTARSRRVIDHGPALILREDPIRFDKDAIPFGDKLKPSASIMTVPIRQGSTVIGILSIQSYTPRAYSTQALSNLQSLADHCGEALNRINAEESFYESEERFRQMAHNFEDVVWLTDRDMSKVLYINPAYERIFRRTCESVYERLTSFLDAIHPADRARVEDLLERQRKGHHEPIEYRIVWPDGSVHWIHRRSLPIRNTEGEVYLVAGIAQDITERKRADESLNLFRNLIEQSSDAIEVIDQGTFRVIDCNASAHRTLGYTREEFLALTVFDIDPSLDHATLARLDADMEKSGFATLESVHRRKDGTTFPVEVNVKLVSLEKVYRLAVVRDITGRKRAEEALRESEERYRELFENAKDAIYLHDLSGRYVSVNRAAERLSGYPRAEILGRHYSNFVAPRNLKHARTNLCKKLDEANETIYEVFMITKDKRAVPVEVSSSLIHENGVPVGVQGIVRDITERKRAQDALQNYSRRLIEAQEAERQHIARELHDEIGQVLTAVKINLQSIQRLGPDSAWMPPLDESIGIVDEALGRVRELSIELRPSLLDDLGLSAALRWYVDRYAQRTGIRAEVMNGFEEEGRLPRELETACFRIAQEALTNVVRHAKANSVSVQLERVRERLVLTISDDGVGFDVEGLFSNAATVAALGLRGMEERALAVRGKIEIESALQNGTRVRATFPFKRRK